MKQRKKHSGVFIGLFVIVQSLVVSIGTGLAATTGAPVPFTTYEAEDPANTTTGTVVMMSGTPSATVATPEMEASGRGYVALTARGQYLDFHNVQAANTIVVRHCIPDAARGGGITATLSLYVNGVFRQSLSLSSTYNWLYGQGGNNGQSNSPSAGSPHVFWDETRFFITGGVNQGDTLRLEKGSSDSAQYYRIDSIDLEMAPAALPPPSTPYLSVMSYGATGNGRTDDTAAIQRCINAAQAAKKIVWIPAGNYIQTKYFLLNGATVQGAGMWYTTIIGTSSGGGFNGNLGFALSGSNSQVHDLFIESTAYTSRNETGGIAFTSNAGPTLATNWTVQNVWITHTLVGFWLSTSSGGIVNGCRVRFTYADGINLNCGSSNNLIENCHVRGTGDDGLAINSELSVPTISVGNSIMNNTVIANWWGHNCDLAGGDDHNICYNYLADNAWSGCVAISLSSAYPMHPLTGGNVAYNTIVRGGGNAGSQQRGAIWIYPQSTTISGVVFQYNDILDSIFHGIHLTATLSQSIQFNNNLIDTAGGDGIIVDPGVTGTGVFNNNTVTNLSAGSVPFLNNSTTYVVSGTGNSW